MEGGDQHVGNGPGGSRWNPTKEQIEMLESLYKQGVRTPTAEQIQQITARLKDYGHIEGKNVFYWFQNHKARQRQKQKHDNFTYLNRFIYTPHTGFCSPCYMAPAKNIDPGFYQQYPKVPPSPAGNFKRSRLVPAERAGYNRPMHGPVSRQSQDQETLDLFPIHPTGILQAKNGITESESGENGNLENKKWATDDNTTSSSENNNDSSVFGNEKAGKGHHFFDFFCRN